MPRASRHIQRRMVLVTQTPSEKWWLHFIASAIIGLWMLVVTLGSNLPFHSDRKFPLGCFWSLSRSWAVIGAFSAQEADF